MNTELGEIRKNIMKLLGSQYREFSRSNKHENIFKGIYTFSSKKPRQIIPTND